MTVKVKYTKQMDDGGFNRVTEPYLLAAMTFGDAENRIYEELGSTIRGEFSVTAITKTEIHDIFGYDDSDIWYKAKVQYENMDEDTGNTKKTTQTFLVSAESVAQATQRVKESLKGMIVDFEITSVLKTPLVEIFPYAENLDKELSRTSEAVV
jgi:hypothetical protein